MPAIYNPPGGGSTLPIFQTAAHADQLGLNDSPANNPGIISGHTFVLPDAACLYTVTTAHNMLGHQIYTHIQQSDRYYDGSEIRAHKGGVGSFVDVDNNDAAYNPLSGVSYNITAHTRVGPNAPSYGTCHAMSAIVDVINQGSSSNEYACWFGYLNAGYTGAPLIAGGNFWFTDWGVQGPIGTRPGILNGISLVTNNFYNGSPSLGSAAGISLQSIQGGTAYATHAGSTSYPWDIGYHVSGLTGGGTADGYTNAIQVGGTVSAWGPTAYAGDQGQVGRGLVVKARNAGNSVARLGAVVSEGTGEGGGLIFGLDTADANRASLWRSANGTLSIHGQVVPASLVSAANDSAAATAGVPVGGIYQTTGTLKVRLT